MICLSFVIVLVFRCFCYCFSEFLSESVDVEVFYFFIVSGFFYSAHLPSFICNLMFLFLHTHTRASHTYTYTRGRTNWGLLACMHKHSCKDYSHHPPLTSCLVAPLGGRSGPHSPRTSNMSLVRFSCVYRPVFIAILDIPRVRHRWKRQEAHWLRLSPLTKQLLSPEGKTVQWLRHSATTVLAKRRRSTGISL